MGTLGGYMGVVGSTGKKITGFAMIYSWFIYENV